MKAQVRLYRAAMPDLQFSVEDLVAEGDTVACRWTARGTHTGPLVNIPPSGRTSNGWPDVNAGRNWTYISSSIGLPLGSTRIGRPA